MDITELAALVVHPGDKLIIRLDTDQADSAPDILDALHGANITALVFVGDAEFTVVRSGD